VSDELGSPVELELDIGVPIHVDVAILGRDIELDAEPTGRYLACTERRGHLVRDAW
jgi:hypothetical protein